MLAMRAASVADGGVALARTRSQKLVSPSAPADILAMVQNVVAATHPRGLMQAARCTDIADVIEDYAPAIACPVLAVTGADDQVNPPDAVGRLIAQAIAGARFETPAGVGHLPELEAPAQTATMLRDHFFRS
jgi:pimeloyl-ACP methyl ester carboxylesterase